MEALDTKNTLSQDSTSLANSELSSFRVYPSITDEFENRSVKIEYTVQLDIVSSLTQVPLTSSSYWIYTRLQFLKCADSYIVSAGTSKLLPESQPDLALIILEGDVSSLCSAQKRNENLERAVNLFCRRFPASDQTRDTQRICCPLLPAWRWCERAPSGLTESIYTAWVNNFPFHQHRQHMFSPASHLVNFEHLSVTVHLTSDSRAT